VVGADPGVRRAGRRTQSPALGLDGDQQIGARIAEGTIDELGRVIARGIARGDSVTWCRRLQAMVWNVPVACNRASADFIISSPLMAIGYQRQASSPNGKPSCVCSVRYSPSKTTSGWSVSIAISARPQWPRS
jgi:hypothetical protein